MSLASGGNGPGKAHKSKIKSNFSITGSSDFTLISYKRNKYNVNSNTLISPVSPTLKAITDNQPSLIGNSSFTSSPLGDVVMTSILASNDKAVNEPSQSTSVIDYYDNKYFGPFICIVQYVDKSSNISHLHPLQFGKLIYKGVDGVVSIQPAGASRVKIAFSSVASANTRFLIHLF